MPTITEADLTFRFPDAWRVEKYDEWTYYRKWFNNFGGQNKAVDILALEPGGGVLWLIEIKDYRSHPRDKVVSISAEVASKVRDTLAGLLAAATRQPHTYDEHAFARDAVRAEHVRVALHLELPAHPTVTLDPVRERANVQGQLGKVLRAIDPHPRVEDRASANRWTVT